MLTLVLDNAMFRIGMDVVILTMSLGVFEFKTGDRILGLLHRELVYNDINHEV